MANVSRINGAIPVRYIGGAAWDGQVEEFYKPAGTTVTHDLAVGCPVAHDGTANSTTGIPQASLWSSGIILGFVTGIKALRTNLNVNYLDGAQDGLIYVCTDPNVLFEMQANAALPITAIGLNAPVIATNAVNTSTGTAGWEVDVANAATTNSLAVKIHRYVDSPDNEIATLYNKVLVSLNYCWRAAGQTGS